MSYVDPSCPCHGTGGDCCDPDPAAQMMAGLSRLCQTVAVDMAAWRGLLAGIRRDVSRASLRTSEPQHAETASDSARRALPFPDTSTNEVFIDRLKKEDPSA